MDEIISVVEHCTTIPLHPRHPYAGELVFTAFSGSHQDAIKKCLSKQRDDEHWQVAYLPIDPADLGRNYEAVIRINSQSGKGGVAWVLENDYGLNMPRWLQIDASRKVQARAEETAGELTPSQIWSVFEDAYLRAGGPDIQDFSLSQSNSEHDGQDQLSLHFALHGQAVALHGSGDGAISALLNGWRQHFGDNVEVLDYSEHALNTGTASQAVAYVLLSINNQRHVGVAMHRDVVSASLQAVINAAVQSQAAAQRKAS